ncbi:hypothetical protein [Algoriphagus confluentis]|uniref:Long-chain fatty acid transport protein n=1 Tax=Algoriphagus confluentis TaxID=1697556 RepID=A0ABQ6PRP4_9BACT|nr:hypothetical protein Aconfl_25480 [Algoriphagus confluentis]
MIDLLEFVVGGKVKLGVLFFLLTTYLAGLPHSPALAQDTHHWGNQFGTRAALLGGAVLTDTVDNAGVFYNPGNLAFLDTTTLTLNANLYGLENIRVENALGEQADFKGLQFNTIPLLISGAFRLKNSFQINYGLLTPVNFKFNGVARIDRLSDLIEEAESPGQEEILAESAISNRLQETTLALGISKKINSNLGIGLSLLNTFRSVDYSYRFSGKTLTNQSTPLLISRSQHEFVNYFTVRTALKAGLNYQGEGLGLGLTVTSPGLSWLGNGTISEDLTLVNVLNPQTGQRQSAYASDRQEKLKAKYKSPFEIGLGAHKTWGKNTISLNVTHFSAIDPYRIIEVEPNILIRPDLLPGISSSDFLNVETAMQAVTNFSLGLQRRINPVLDLMGSFRSDFSFYDPEPALGTQITTEFTQWDIFHITFGGIINKNQSNLTLGLVYSFGSTDSYFQENSFSDSDPNPPLEGSLIITEAAYSNIGLLIGYSFYFKKLN